MRAGRCPRVAVSASLAVMVAVVVVIAVTVALPIVVFVTVMAVVVIIVVLAVTVVMVAVGDGRGVMQHLLLEGGDLPPQQLLQRGGVCSGRVLRLDNNTWSFAVRRHSL